jgi:hypothetical protein
MELTKGAIWFVIFAAAVLGVISQRWLIDALIEAMNNFRGGPPAGMHPLPADDGALLRKRSRKTAA